MLNLIKIMANKIKYALGTIATIGTLGLFWAGNHLYNHNIKSPTMEENIQKITNISNIKKITLDIGRYSIPGLFEIGRHNGAGIYYHGETKDNEKFQGFVQTSSTLGRIFEMEKHGLKRAEEIAKKVESHFEPQGIETIINRMGPNDIRPYVIYPGEQISKERVINLARQN